MNSTVLEHWMPREFIADTAIRPRDEFVGRFANTSFLLVQIDDPSSELAAGLVFMSSLSPAEPQGGQDNLGFSTVAHDSKAVMQMLADRKSQADAGGEARPTVCTPEMRKIPHFIVPVRKREDTAASFLERISVGRARNHDVVLRHRSVSKFHAWFEYDTEGRLFVRDAESKNYTFVDGQKVLSTKTEVSSGSRVKFGSVECVVAGAEDIWACIHAG